jgi:hypothetical protein
VGSAITVDTTPGITSHSKNEEFALCDALTAKPKGSTLDTIETAIALCKTVAATVAICASQQRFAIALFNLSL